jgi:hypothetical protein
MLSLDFLRPSPYWPYAGTKNGKRLLPLPNPVLFLGALGMLALRIFIVSHFLRPSLHALAFGT